MADRQLVSITIVTYNSARFITQCLRYAFDQDLENVEIIVIDNASSDETVSVLGSFEDRVRIVYNRENTGFAAAQNQAIALSRGDWILTLNPDVRLSRSFLRTALAAAAFDDSIGSVCGKLLAMAPSFEVPPDPVFDSTGIYFTPNLRHFDRGSKLPDRGEYDHSEFVFGATGAACLYRRRMIDNIAIFGDFFDPDFFAYREDADVAWRAQLLGWKCLYTPLAVAHHVRNVLPTNRGRLPALINMHSVKNRWLLRIKNMTPALYRKCWLPVTCRDCVVIAACVLREFSSLRAFVLLFRAWPSARRKRREIMRARRATDTYLAAWFSWTPVSYPAPGPAVERSIEEKMASG
jgi:GT2 family glycosyltransferase